MSVVTKNECKRMAWRVQAVYCQQLLYQLSKLKVPRLFVCSLLDASQFIDSLMITIELLKKNKLIMDSNSWEATNKHLVLRRIRFIISVWYWFFFGMFFFCTQETYFFEIPNKSIDKNQKKIPQIFEFIDKSNDNICNCILSVWHYITKDILKYLNLIFFSIKAHINPNSWGCIH